MIQLPREVEWHPWPANFFDPIEAILKGGAKFIRSSCKCHVARILGLAVGKRFGHRLACFSHCCIPRTKDCCTIGKRNFVGFFVGFFKTSLESILQLLNRTFVNSVKRSFVKIGIGIIDADGRARV